MSAFVVDESEVRVFQSEKVKTVKLSSQVHLTKVGQETSLMRSSNRYQLRNVMVVVWQVALFRFRKALEISTRSQPTHTVRDENNSVLSRIHGHIRSDDGFND